MRRLSIAAIVVVFVSLIFTTTAHSDTACKQTDVRAIIRCGVDRWPVPGGSMKAISVAMCESSLNPNAYYAGNAGIFQQNVYYWPDRQNAYNRATGPRYDVAESVYNARANVLVSVRMAHFYGWGAWSCA